MRKEGRDKGTRLLKIGKAIFEVNDKNKVFQFLERNPKWRELSKEESEANQKSLDGYTRKFGKTGKMKLFSYKE